MKTLTTLIVGLFLTISTYCQDSEFEVYPNGLIYSEQAMGKLSRVVDSLNLRFKTCDFNKVFYSMQQAIGHLVTLDSGNIKSAKRDLERNISFEDFCKKYPNAKIDKHILILRRKFTNYEKRDVVQFEHFNLKSDYGLSIETEDLTLHERNMQNKWIFEYYKKTDYSNESIQSFFFPANFTSITLPKKYSMMVGYADCLIDTTTVPEVKLKDGFVELPDEWISLPQREKEEILSELRATRVLGSCSMDNRPRRHAINIALLSAETYNWEVFLKAHLDIMNDRFDRISDGSYAWEKRNTYIKELEEQNINVTDLILGICLRIENPSTNHYYGSIGRVGRALSETKNRIEIEETILSAVSNTELDNYNRLLFYFLFLRYNDYIEDEKVKKANNDKLARAVSTLPDYFRSKLASN